MAEVDTSSYLKPAPLPVQKSLLDNVNQFQQLESNRLVIDQQKVDLVNKHFKIMQSELSNLANDPKVTPQEVVQKIHAIGDTFGMPDAVKKQAENEFAGIPNTPLGKDGTGNPLLSRKLDFVLRRGMDMNQRINAQYGADTNVGNGQTVTPAKIGLRGGPLPIQAPIQQQAPPTQIEYDVGNQPRFAGPQAPQLPAGAVPIPRGFPGQYRMGGLPVAPTTVGNVNPPPGGPTPALPVAPRSDTGTTINQTANQVVQNRSPAGAAAGPTPGAAEGLALRTADQNTASGRMMAAKPAIQALPLMQTPGFLAGPLTEQFSHVVAALKSTGLVDTATENDPTVIRQEVVKKLAQYVAGNPVGQRSDASQRLVEEATANPKVHLLPALIKLTKDAVALDRVQAAMPNAFKDKDYSKYGQHKATFPQSVDERAFTLDLEPENKSSKLVDDMGEQLKSSNKREVAQAEKFFKSLRIAKEQGFYQ